MDNFATRLDEHTVQFVRILPGPIERVWSYLADSDKRRQWLGSGALPARVGEGFSLHIKHSDYWPATADQRAIPAKAEHGMTHVLLALEPPHLLAYSFQPEGWEETTVEFRLTQEESGQVRLTLTHSRVGSRPHVVDVSRGWHGHLDVLAHKLKGEPVPPFGDVWRAGLYEKHYTDSPSVPVQQERR